MKKNIQNIRKAVCTMANELRKKGLTLSQAFRKAWKRVKEGMIMRVAGTTFENRQQRLAFLSQFRPDRLQAVLERETGNQHDGSAIRVIIRIPEIRRRTVIGYIPAAISGDIARLIDKGMDVRADMLGVIGGYSYKENYGLLLKVAI
ncbi:MAG: hypothetical protein IKQ25_12800 [Lachnospiraceae bacterium]|nr:hypothetical protein [Lachnospiraceae bacterium]